MEKLICTFVILCSLFIAATNATSSYDEAEAEKWVQNSIFRRNQQPDLTLNLYVQDAIGGPSPTVWEVARSKITSRSNTSFGLVRVVDDLITSGPKPNSKKLGRLQGLITCTDLHDVAVTFNLIFVFQTGKLNGSTFSIMGRSLIFDPYRELPIVGGTGVFRRASGFVSATTYNFYPDKYAILKYTINLYH